ncbi:SHD1 domain-containing protein [Rhodopirellula europaea]|uniref:Cytoskeleton assembly control protein SLA1-putative secreted or membrane associated protein n=1 Tax=Rhodopirellula europaea 6C TaxID=1263867 RepID=M2AKU4_9BACT|nr:SHD1 domain-containing protein [Rhodopirellula europaea]EMB13317.1 cytoskeleton assembly control protein SLA1-putative secreted or membrane associated protein [Rhodopirellula europaea 6C]
MFRIAIGIIPSLLFCLIFVTAQDNQPSTERVWKDSSGRFQVTAKLIEQVGKKVVLQTRSGRKIEIPSDRLSDADQTYLKNMESAPSSPAPPSPDADQPKPIEVSNDPEAELDAAPRLKFSNTVWNVKVSDPKSSEFEPNPVALPKPHGNRQAHAANSLLMKAAVSDISGSGPSAQTRLMIGDFRTGQLTELPAVPGTAMQPIAILGDGSTVVMIGMGKDRTTTNEDLQSWDIRDGKVQRGDIWKPYAGQSNPGIRFATAGPDNRLITCSKGGHIVAWQMPQRRALWQIEMGSPPYWHTNADLSQLAIASATQLVMVDLSEGKITGSQSLSDLGRIYYPKVSFNPSEDKLYLSSIGRVLILDLRKNEWIQDTEISGVGTSNGAIFCDDDYVLIDGSTLVDWKSGNTVDQHSGLGAPLQIGHFACAVSSSSLQALDFPITPVIENGTSPKSMATDSANRPKEVAADKPVLEMVGRWSFELEETYASGNKGMNRSTYRFAPDGTYEVYSTLAMSSGSNSQQLYSVTSRERGTWTHEGKKFCMTETKSDLVEFQSSVPEVSRQTFETAIAQKSPPVCYAVFIKTKNLVEFRDTQGNAMPLQRITTELNVR